MPPLMKRGEALLEIVPIDSQAPTEHRDKKATGPRLNDTTWKTGRSNCTRRSRYFGNHFYVCGIGGLGDVLQEKGPDRAPFLVRRMEVLEFITNQSGFSCLPMS